MFDVVIIGAGVTGSAIAREISRYKLNVCVIEKEEDVCNETSKANSAIIHAGFDAVPGTMKAKLNVMGNAMMDRIAEELDIPFKRNGSLVVCTKEQDPEGLRRKYNLPRNYFLCLSTLEPRKNLQLLLKAYGNLLGKRREDVKGSTANREADIPVVIPEKSSTECQDIPALVLAGRKGWLMDEILADIENKYPGKVIVTGFIEDADLPQIYRMADCFVFPSLYEGFGMPPLEALAVGTPVISSDAASMPEVLGDHAAYFASGNEAELTKALQTFLKQPKTQEQYTDSRFDWKRSAEKILHVLMLETKHE